MFILTPDPLDEGAKQFIIEDSPESIPVKGMSFTVAPSTIEQEIAAWIALAAADPRTVPPTTVLWKWYEKRKEAKLTNQMMLELARFCLISDVPAFYWLQGCEAESIKPMLLSAAAQGRQLDNLAATAAFWGKGFFKEFTKRLGQKAERFPPRLKRYPSHNLHDIFGMQMLQPARRIHKTEAAFCQHLEKRLNGIAASIGDSETSAEPGVLDRREAVLIDCYMYAQRNRYTSKAAVREGALAPRKGLDRKPIGARMAQLLISFFLALRDLRSHNLSNFHFIPFHLPGAVSKFQFLWILSHLNDMPIAGCRLRFS